MKVWQFVRSLKARQLWALVKLCFLNLNKVLPTWKATNRSLAQANKLYGKEHRRNTPANAFRHAFWNYLIARKCLKRPEQTHQVLEWTKNITDLHEEIFPNSDLARSMDLHNNKVGRRLFVEYATYPEEAVQQLLQQRTVESIRIGSEEELKEIPYDCLVHMINTIA